MSRRCRFAIAHFAEAASALSVRRALVAQGADAAGLRLERAETAEAESCRLEVPLPVLLEKRLLDILLASAALRVDVHDAAL